MPVNEVLGHMPSRVGMTVFKQISLTLYAAVSLTSQQSCLKSVSALLHQSITVLGINNSLYSKFEMYTLKITVASPKGHWITTMAGVHVVASVTKMYAIDS